MRTPLTYVAFVILSFTTSFQLMAQDSEAQINRTSNGKLFRPQLSVGTGLISYFGDIGNLNGVSKQKRLNWGYQLGLQSPVSNTLDLNIFYFTGKITAEERLATSNANFQSPIRMGGLSLAYNFSNFLPEDRNITPFLSVGISTFEFNPKSDNFDANGNPYHYWEDGTIRNLPEISPNKNQAEIIQRDYNYETDLRQTNETNTPYALRGVSIPVSAGAILKVNNNFNLKMGTEFHYSFTDNLDNISSENSEGMGNQNGNDHFMFTSIGLLYNLHHNKKGEALPEGLDLPEMEFEDEDVDGVADIIDQCPFTPKNVEVTLYGCPVDSDKDGVADYMDKEVNSAENAIVNLEGVTMSDEDIELMYLTYMDSIGNLSFQKSRTSTADYEGNTIAMRNREKGYRVVIRDDGNLNNDEISRLLSLPDIKSETKGDKTIYYLGEYKTIDEAVEREQFLATMNYSAELVYNEFGTFSAVDKDEIRIARLFADEVNENTGVIFRVQIGAYRHRMSQNIFNSVPDLLTIEGSDGLTRYVSGSFKSIQEAAEHKIELLLEGFEGAFVTAYKGGKRITLKEAGARMSNEEETLETTPSSGHINKEFVKYSVQLGAFSGRVPAETLNDFMNLGNVRPMRGDNGETRYVFNTYETKTEAEKMLQELKAKGFSQAKVVGEFNGQLISAEEAFRIKEK